MPTLNQLPARTAGLASLLAMLLLAPVGCGPIKAPEFRGPITVPEVHVDRVEVVERTAEAGRYRVILTIDNPNDEPLPLPLANYTVEVDGREYTTDTVPNATLPAGRRLTIALPAVVEEGGDIGASYRAIGWVHLQPEGQIKRFFYGLGWPLPRAMFFGQGRVMPAVN